MIKNSRKLPKSLQHLWIPCSSITQFKEFSPPEIVKAEGSYFHLANGQSIIDGISSWWCKSLGHQHPRLKKALERQMNRFEHVMLGNMTNPIILELSERLAKIFSPLTKVHYASDGSCAVEIALKMSVHAQALRGEKQRTQWMSLSNSFHGETGLALAVSDSKKFRDPYNALLRSCEFINNLPYVHNTRAPLWENCAEHWENIEKQLRPHADHLAAIIVEPIVQSTAGMKIYSKDLLIRLRDWASEHNVFLIADEIMTGFGRTGKTFAYEYADITPDFVCLGKALTAGYLPLSAMLTTQNIFDLFSGGDDLNRTFWHSHTYGGNALAAAVAIEALQIYEDEKINERVMRDQSYLLKYMLDVAETTGKLNNVRQLGWIAAADLISDNPQAGFEFFKKGLEFGALLRPLGNTIYWFPPLNCEITILDKLRDITIRAIREIL